MIRRYKLSMVFKILLAHCSSSVVAADFSIPQSPFPQVSVWLRILCFDVPIFFRCERISEPNLLHVHLTIRRTGSSVRRYSDAEQSFPGRGGPKKDKQTPRGGEKRGA